MWSMINKPWLWGLIYLSLIPSFAFIYQHNGAQFKHNSFLEGPEYRERAVTLFSSLRELTVALMPELSKNLPLASTYQLSGLRFRKIETNNQSVEIDAFLIFHNSQGQDPATRRRLNRIKITLSHRYDTVGAPNGIEYIFALVDGDRPTTLVREFIRNNYDRDWLGNKTATYVENDFLKLNFRDIDKIGHPVNLLAVQDGISQFMDQLDGQLQTTVQRLDTFMYLSAVTVTTLGFGDIVPVGNLGRSLIGTQAVLGVVFIGLFLNSISSKPQNTNKPKGTKRNRPYHHRRPASRPPRPRP